MPVPASASPEAPAKLTKIRQSAVSAGYNPGAARLRTWANEMTDDTTNAEKVKSTRRWQLKFWAAVTMLAASPWAFAAPPVDADAAEELAKKGDCFKCHSVTKAKKAPAYAKIAKKYKNQPDAFDILYKHITGRKVVKFEDGEEERHQPPPTANDADLGNLIRWILSRDE